MINLRDGTRVEDISTAQANLAVAKAQGELPKSRRQLFKRLLYLYRIHS